jgi:hypothetical protein
MADEVKGLDEAVAEPKNQSAIFLVSKASGKRFEVKNRTWICVSHVLQNALDGEPDTQEIDFDCREDLLELIVEYMDMCKGQDIPEVPKPLSSKLMNEVMTKSPFNNAEPFAHKIFATYIDRIGDADKQQLYDLVMASNFLNIKGLLHLGLAKVCTWIKGFPIGDLKHRLLPNGPDGKPLKEFRPHFSMGAPRGVEGHSLAAEMAAKEATKASSSAAAAVPAEDDSGAAAGGPAKKQKE